MYSAMHVIIMSDNDLICCTFYAISEALIKALNVNTMKGILHILLKYLFAIFGKCLIFCPNGLLSCIFYMAVMKKLFRTKVDSQR